MKKLFIILGLLLSLSGFTQNYWHTKSVTESLSTADLLLLYQSGTSKNFTIGTLAAMLNDSSDVLRTEFPPLWRVDIADTADVLRLEIANASTTDTAWTATADDYVLLKVITDSVGVGIVTPTEKFHVVGRIKATAGLFDNGYANVLLGNDNTGLALQAGAVQNVFLGNDVAKVATTPGYSVGIGYQTLYSATTGLRNVAIGRKSGYYLTDADDNVFIGDVTGYATTTGDDNVYIGSTAGEVTSSSSSGNVYIGTLAGGVGLGSNNFFGGYQAGWNSTGSQGVTIGALSGQGLTENSFALVGYNSGKLATSSVGLTAVGGYSASALTTSDYHTVMGYRALDAVQTNDGSSVYGYQSATNAVSAANLSTYGYQSGLALTTGDANSFFGANTGILVTTGSHNTGVGASVLGNTSVDLHSVTAVGSGAGYSNTGDSCIFLGRNAGYDNTASNVLFIDNSNTATPLLEGYFATDSLIINGDLRATGYSGGANAWTEESDKRLKENIEPITNALDIVGGLEGVRFDWKDNRRGKTVGFIAQDVEKVLPEVVDPGETYAMQTSQITAVLVEAIKEQQKMIESQQKQIDKLTRKINRMK